MANEPTIEQIRNNIKEWCFSKRNELEQLDPQSPTCSLQQTNCMFEAIFWIMADMEIRLRKLEQSNNQQAQASVGFDFKSRDWEKEQIQPASEESIKLMKERWMAEGKRECTDCGSWFKSEGRCPECNPLG